METTMKTEQKELLETLKDILNPFLYATKFDDPEDPFSGGTTFNIPMALSEIAKALNRIADQMAKK